MPNPESFRGYPDLDSGAEARLRTLVDNAGFPINVAYKAVTGIEPDQPSVPRPRVSPESHHPAASHRGGRSYSEPSDSDLDPYWNQKPKPLSEEESAAQQQTNREGRRLAEQMLLQGHVDRIRREALERDIPFAALLRARNARRHRPDV